MGLNIYLVLKTSLQVALLTSFLVMLVALFLGLWLNSTRSKLAKLCELFIYVPMAMPPVALGYGLLVLFAPQSTLGFWLEHNLGIRIAFTFWGAVLASFLVSLGIGLRAVRLALEQIDEHHSQIAELVGASKSQVFFHITLPLCYRALMGGAILVFLRSLGEFGATIVVAGNTLGSTRTLALAIWTDMQTPEQESAALFLVILAALLSLLALGASELLLKTNNKFKLY
jgi:molybdate transport system permease protein